jgi:HSP20 family protein
VESRRKPEQPGLRRLQSDVDSMFLDLLRGERVPRFGRVVFRPSADVYFDKSKNAVVVKLDLAGIDPAEVDLEVDENALRISGVRSDQRHPDAVYQQMEITYGPFERVVMLPPGVDQAGASADYSSGYLEVVLPMKPRPTRKKISIEHKDEQQREEGR